MTYDRVMEGIVYGRIAPENEAQKEICVAIKNQFDKWAKACAVHGYYDPKDFFIYYGGTKDEGDMIKRIEEAWDCEQL